MTGVYRDEFKGTAWYYARFRPAYPTDFFACLARAFALPSAGRLLDLGCGTGQIALPLARQLSEVVAMDPEPEMLDEARLAAAEAGVTNVRFVHGGSADLSALKQQLGMFDLVTMGSSFHWMDRVATLAVLSEMVAPGGGIVVASGGSLWTNPAPWCQSVKRTVQRWLGEERRAGSSVYAVPQARHEEIIDRSPFGPHETRIWRYAQSWTVDAIIGYLYSTSFCSPAILGPRRDAFEQDMRQTLLSLSPDGLFSEEVTLDVHLGFLKPL